MLEYFTTFVTAVFYHIFFHRIKYAADRAKEEAQGAAIFVNGGDFFQVCNFLLHKAKRKKASKQF